MRSDDPRWRAHGQELPLRKFIREHCPNDLVVEDLDLVLRYVTDDDPFGRFRLVECKVGWKELPMGQKMTFGLMDALFRIADPEGVHYEGWFVLRTDTVEVEHLSDFVVNGAHLTREQFIDWVSFGSTTVSPREPAPNFTRFIAAAG